MRTRDDVGDPVDLRPGEPLVRRLLSLVFRHEFLTGHGRCDYLHRWTLLRLPGGRALYLHCFVGSDWSRDMHDHPRAFTSVGLRGAYVEETPPRPELQLRPLVPGAVRPSVMVETFRAPWFRRFPPHHIHRIQLVTETVWTLVCVGPRERDWGFYPDGRFVPFEDYVDSARADEAKIC